MTSSPDPLDANRVPQPPRETPLSSEQVLPKDPLENAPLPAPEFSRRWFGIRLASWIVGISLAIGLLGWIQLHKTLASVSALVQKAHQLEGEPGRQLEMYRRALSNGYEPTAEIYTAMADARLALMPPDWISALDDLEKAAILEPLDFRLHVRLSSMYLQVEEPSKAVPHARTACEVGKDSPVSWQTLAAATQAQARKETSLSKRTELIREGLSAHRKQIALNPADAVPYLESLRMFADLANCIADAEAYQQEAELLSDALTGALDQLKGQIDQALNARPGDRQILRDRATLALVTGDEETARKALSSLLPQPESAPWAATLLGWIEANSQNDQRAGELLRLAGGAAEPMPLAWIRYSQITRKTGNPQAALDFLRPLTQSPQAPPELFLEIGQLSLASGQIGPAATLAQEISARFPGQGWDQLLEAHIALREGLFSAAADRLVQALPKAAGQSRQTHWLLAEAQTLAGQYTEAAQTLDSALILWPDSPDLLASRALVAQAMNRADQAITFAQAALALSPGNLDAAQAAARAMIQLRRFDQARKILDQLAAVHPRDPRPYLLRAEVESAAGETGRAIEQLEIAAPLPMSPTLAAQIASQKAKLEEQAGAQNWEERFRLALNQNQIRDAVETLGRAAKTFGAIRSVKAANAALLLFQGRSGEALQALEKLKSEAPNPDPVVTLYLMTAYLRTGKTEEAVQLGQAAAVHFPARTEILEILSQAYSATGRNQEAVQTLRDALKLAPSQDHIYAALASELQKNGELAEAIQVLEDGRNIQGPSFESITLRLADCLSAAGSSDQALALAMEAHQNDPENLALAFYLAQLLWASGNTTEADNTLKRAAEAQPNSLDCVLATIQYYRGSGRPRLALEQCTEGIRKFPTSPEILKHKGTLEFGLGQFQNGIQSFQKAIRFDPQNAVTYLDVVRELNLAGLRNDGVEVLQIAVRALPNSLDCRLGLAQQLFEVGRIDEAWQQITVAKELETGLAERTLLMAGGFILSQLERQGSVPFEVDKILTGLQSVARNHPQFQLSQFLAAKIYLQMGEAEHCIALFKELLQEPLYSPDPALKLLEFQQARMDWAGMDQTIQLLTSQFPNQPAVIGAVAQSHIARAESLADTDPQKNTLLDTAETFIKNAVPEGTDTGAGFAGARLQISALRNGPDQALAELNALEPLLQKDTAMRFLHVDLLKQAERWSNARDVLLDILTETGDEAALFDLARHFQSFQVTMEDLVAAAKGHDKVLPPYALTCAAIYLKSTNGQCNGVIREINDVQRSVVDADWLFLLGCSSQTCDPENPLALTLYRKALSLDPYHEDNAMRFVQLMRLRPNTQDEIKEVVRKVRNLHPNALKEMTL